MILKSITIQEINFHDAYVNGIKKIKLLSNFDRYMTIFWFLGPFIYLIERDPADLWLTLLALVFLIRSFVKKDWDWCNQIWFKLAIAFWISSLVSASLSPDPIFSLSQGIPWIRFPLFAAASQAWFGKDRDMRILMFISIILGLLIMNFILFAEVLIDPKIRLTWPYGDTIPGVYLAKFGLPIICTLFVLNFNKINFVISLFLIFTITILFLTGERTHFILLICSCFMSSVFWKPKFLRYIISSITILGIVIVASHFRPDTFNRFFPIQQFFSQGYYIIMYALQDEEVHSLVNQSKKVINGTNKINPIFEFMSSSQLKKFNSNTLPVENYNKIQDGYNIAKNISIGSYWGAWRGGIQQGLEKPFLGIGPSGTRNTCASLPKNSPSWLPGENYCGNHPHNFYVQLFAETGTIGLSLGILMFFFIIKSSYLARKINKNCPMTSIAFVIPFALFFPIQQFGSFFGQWGNLFIWFSIGFSLSQYQGWKKNE